MAAGLVLLLGVTSGCGFVDDARGGDAEDPVFDASAPTTPPPLTVETSPPASVPLPADAPTQGDTVPALGGPDATTTTEPLPGETGLFSGPPILPAQPIPPPALLSPELLELGFQQKPAACAPASQFLASSSLMLVAKTTTDIASNATAMMNSLAQVEITAPQSLAEKASSVRSSVPTELRGSSSIGRDAMKLIVRSYLDVNSALLDDFVTTALVVCGDDLNHTPSRDGANALLDGSG